MIRKQSGAPLRLAITVTVTGVALVSAMALLLRPSPPPQPVELPPLTPVASAAGEEALRAAELAARQHPEDPERAVQAGSTAGDRKHYSDALRWFQQAARQDPKLLPAVTGQGQMWMQLGRPGLAAAMYEKALRLAPDNPQLLLELARSCAYLRDFDRALKWARAAEKLSPDSAEVHRGLANIYAEVLSPELSLKHATRACELDPNDAENWSSRGAIQLRGRHFAEAESDLRRALTLNPGHVAANLLFARTVIERLKTPEADRQAFAALTRVRMLEPAHAEALQIQGEILVRAGRLPEALLLLRQAREADPRNPAILLALGQALIRSGKGEEGVVLVSQSQKLAPQGIAFLDLEALARKNPDPRIAERLADLYVRQELYDSAIQVLERALRRSPSNDVLRRKLAATRARAAQS